MIDSCAFFRRTQKQSSDQLGDPPTVQIFNSAGVYQREFGGSRGSFSDFGGYGPPYIADRGNGQIYLGSGFAIDPTTHNIVVLDGSGRVEIFAPAGGAQPTATVLTSINPSITAQSVTFTATVAGSGLRALFSSMTVQQVWAQPLR